MSVSKAWDWKAGANPFWLEPSQESYYLMDRWKKIGFKTFLDFGCGLGRHAVFFASNGFDVSAFDLSEDAVNHVKAWAKRDGLRIDAQCADMLKLPYADASFDCLLAYFVISHNGYGGHTGHYRRNKAHP